MLVPTLLKSNVQIPLVSKSQEKKNGNLTKKWVKPNSSNLQALAPIANTSDDEDKPTNLRNPLMSTGTKLKLLAFWKKNQHPSKDEISSLAIETNQVEHRISMWFKNMRKRHRIKEKVASSSLKIDSTDDSSDEIVISGDQMDVITKEPIFSSRLLDHLKELYAHSDCLSDSDCHQIAARFDVPVESIREWYRQQRDEEYKEFEPSKNLTEKAKENARFLENEYQKYQFLQRDQALMLSSITELSVTQIMNWFQNRRAKKQRNKQRKAVRNSVDRCSSDEIIIEASALLSKNLIQYFKISKFL